MLRSLAGNGKYLYSLICMSKGVQCRAIWLGPGFMFVGVLQVQGFCSLLGASSLLGHILAVGSFFFELLHRCGSTRYQVASYREQCWYYRFFVVLWLVDSLCRGYFFLEPRQGPGQVWARSILSVWDATLRANSVFGGAGYQSRNRFPHIGYVLDSPMRYCITSFRKSATQSKIYICITNTKTLTTPPISIENKTIDSLSNSTTNSN